MAKLVVSTQLFKNKTIIKSKENKVCVQEG